MNGAARWAQAVAAWALMILLPREAGAQVVLQTRHLRLEIGSDAVVRRLVAQFSGIHEGWLAEPAPIAVVYRGGQMAIASQEDFVEDQAPVYCGGTMFPATRASLAGELLRIEFAGAGARATYRVTKANDYLALRLEKLEGEPVDRIDLVQLRVKRGLYFGPGINVVYDDRFGICLCGGNLQTNAGMIRHPHYVEMKAIATREVALEGATAVLLGCPDPKARFLDLMEVVERDFHMPPGARHRRSPVQRYSYLWCSPTPDNVHQYIELAKRAGLRMILFSYTSFSEGAGHFRFNSRFPNGEADLKRVADAIRNSGLHVGLHIHYSKAVRTDPYVTPVPDPRLHQVRRFTLAAAIDEKTETIPVVENPAGCTRDKDRGILRIGQELVAYRDYTTQPPWRFTGCVRGHLKTTAAPHAQGDAAGLLNVDDWVIFLRFDQNTDIQDEVAQRIAHIVRQTGPYDMLYFDGAEDVHDPFWYHVAGAQLRVYRLLEPQPPVCEGAMGSHFSWHILTRSNAYDLPEKHMKRFCYEISCRTAPIRAMDFTRMDFGWIFGFFSHMGPDVLEYLLSRAAGWDCPISIRADPKQVAAHPRAQDCLDVIKLWEDARIEGRLSESQRAMLRTRKPEDYEFIKTWHAVFHKRWIDAWSKTKLDDQEHHLFLNEKGQHELVPIQEIPGAADGRIKAYSFQRETHSNETCVLLWAVKGEVRLLVPVAPDRLVARKPFAAPLAVQAQQGHALVPIGGRTYLVFPGMEADNARQIISQARILP